MHSLFICLTLEELDYGELSNIYWCQGDKNLKKKKKESELWAITFCLGQSLGMLKFDLGG